MSLAYSNMVGTDFTDKVHTISGKLGINPNWLMQVMYSESRLKPTAYNPSGASGLIQFMPSTAAALGTSTSAIRNMSAVDQLDYVYAYFRPYAGKMKSYYDLYLATFFPGGIGKPDSWIFHSSRLSAATIAMQNPAININKDGQITIAEFKQYLKNTVPAQYKALIFSGLLPGIIVFVAVAALFTILK